jgi:hypothetical protein
MRRRPALLVATLAVALGAALIARAGAAGSTTFRTPDAGAACMLTGHSLVCSTLGSPGSVELHGRSGLRVVSRLPWWDASTPVLHNWHHGAISCRLTGDAILCRNGSAAIRVTALGFSVVD